jgi:hypothetical protein
MAKFTPTEQELAPLRRGSSTLPKGTAVVPSRRARCCAHGGMLSSSAASTSPTFGASTTTNLVAP